MPGFLQRGRFHLFFDEGNFTEMRFRMGFSPHEGLDEVDGWFRAALVRLLHAGLPAPVVRRGARVRAHRRLRHHQSWLPAKGRVRVRALPGLRAGTSGSLRGFAVPQPARSFVRLRSDSSGRISRTGATDNPEGTIKSVLSSYGYDFDRGGSGRLLLSLVYANFEAGLRFVYGQLLLDPGRRSLPGRRSRRSSSSTELISYRALARLPAVARFPSSCGPCSRRGCTSGWVENVEAVASNAAHSSNSA